MMSQEPIDQETLMRQANSTLPVWYWVLVVLSIGGGIALSVIDPCCFIRP